jgi:bifunctional UDP-N-acetylglucosamine pyrophosphorylase/glucosamine-1-phosphate N-acetyltransferase
VAVHVTLEGERRAFPTGQTLFGAVIGDDAIVSGGCLLQAGTVIGRRCLVYPQCSITGYIPHDSLVRPTASSFEVLPKGEKGLSST